ncbi:hypothetical protein ACRALDRAFT_1032533 [Sodiomyces alcalophilus JCM 7366]|uniref:uncharacterized protein n=1 Tax=Sodiomyces alcalophilus JCM 7366 TaxID=591952 RepID=UPI0039B54955
MRQHRPGSTWMGYMGPARLDLRSDTITTPTPAMLAAVERCSLMDDVFMEDPTTIDLEAHIAALTGKEAGLLVLSGTMGNQLALRSLLTQPPYSVLCDHRSHIVQYEAGGVSFLTGALVKTVMPRNGIYLTLDDISQNSCTDEDVHSCPTKAISLENTLNGVIMPLSEIKRISAFARQHSIGLHCDGARLWEATAAGAGSLADFCSLFDTVSLCFSKGLGAPIGSILVGTSETIKRARWVRKSIGGGLRQAGVVAGPARVAVDETFGKGPNGHGGLLQDSHIVAKKIEELWAQFGGGVLYPVQTNMCWLDLQSAGLSTAKLVKLGQDAGLSLIGNRLVAHYQIAQNQDDVLQRLEQVFGRLWDGAPKGQGDEESNQKRLYLGRV